MKLSMTYLDVNKALVVLNHVIKHVFSLGKFVEVEENRTFALCFS